MMIGLLLGGGAGRGGPGRGEGEVTFCRIFQSVVKKRNKVFQEKDSWAIFIKSYNLLSTTINLI